MMPNSSQYLNLSRWKMFWALHCFYGYPDFVLLYAPDMHTELALPVLGLNYTCKLRSWPWTSIYAETILQLFVTQIYWEHTSLLACVNILLNSCSGFKIGTFQALFEIPTENVKGTGKNVYLDVSICNLQFIYLFISFYIN